MDSVRSALNATWFGSILLRATIIVGMLGSYVAAVIVLREKIRDSFNNVQGAGLAAIWMLLFAPLVFIAIFSVGPELWQRLQKYRRERRAMNVDLAPLPSPNFRLDPYVPADPDDFCRADNAHTYLLDWLENNSRTVLFLSGTSGSGKSSVLEGFALPKLRTLGWKVLSVRAFDNPLVTLNAALAVRGDSHAKLLIVFDQFEEFLILEDRAQSEDRREFIQRVNSLSKSDHGSLHCLFVVRSDFLQGIVQLGLDDLISGANWIGIEPFRRPAARLFLKESPLRPSDDLVENVLDGAQRVEEINGFFRGITLNMLGLALQKFDREVTSSPRKLIQDYLRDGLLQKEIGPISPSVVRCLITEDGTKQPKRIAEIVATTGLNENEVKLCLALLSARGLVRPLDDKRTLWEISHDFVAKQLGILIESIRPSPWRRSMLVTSVLAFFLTLFSLGMTASYAALSQQERLSEFERSRAREMAIANFEVEKEISERAYLLRLEDVRVKSRVLRDAAPE